MFGDPHKFFNSIAEKSNLREGSEGVYRIIFEMHRRLQVKISNKELAKIVKLPVPVLSAVRSELLNVGFLETKSIFSPSALRWIKKNLNLTFSIDFFNEFSSNSSIPLSKKYLDFFSPVIEYLNKRPSPEYKYDQSRSTIETVLRRSLIMLKNGDVEGKNIVILGDDDGVSIALAFLRVAKEIFVLDIDSRILNLIEGFSKQENLSKVLKTQLWDIRNSMPSEWHHRFDTFETDPPYTTSGFKLFIEQAITLLKYDSGGKGYISFGNKTPFETWDCQRYLLETGFKIDEFIQNFNQYKGATILGNISNLYIISPVPHKLRRFETKYPENLIYTFDEAKIQDIPSIGYQIIGEFYGVQPKYLNEAELLKTILLKGIDTVGLRKEEIFVKEYFPYGISIIVILTESHCNIHTWPEHNYLSLDLFVCDEKEKADKLFYYLLDKINPNDYHKFQFFRGAPSISQ